MNFNIAVDFIFEFEGGYVYDLADPGGKTKYGISQRQYPDINISKLTRQEALEIYKKDYWDACRCDDLPDELKLAVFDCGVNQGCDGNSGFVAQKLLQRVLHVSQDGIIGPITLNTLWSFQGKFERLLQIYLTERALRYAKTKRIEKFGHGWFRRLFVIAMTGV